MIKATLLFAAAVAAAVRAAAAWGTATDVVDVNKVRVCVRAWVGAG